MVDASTADLDRRVRKFVFETFLERAVPPVVEEIGPRFAMPRVEAESSLERLERSRHLKLVPGTHRILMAFPFSAVATPFVVVLPDRRRYFANCAWDAIAFRTMLHQSIRVESYCHHCSVPLALELAHGTGERATAETAVVYLGLPARDWWNDIVHSCSNTMLFFASPTHEVDWRADRPNDPGQVLSVEQVAKLSEPIYAHKLELEYERPTKEEMVRLFSSLGLSGPFWEL